MNTNRGDFKAQGDHTLSPEEIAVIEDWTEKRIALLADRTLDDIHRAVDHLNQTAHWAQTKASDQALEEITDELLLAMHDLRSVLVRKKADRIGRNR